MLAWLSVCLAWAFSPVVGEDDASCLLQAYQREELFVADKQSEVGTGQGWQGRKDNAGILFVVLSHSSNYETQVDAIMNTWGGDVREVRADGLLIVGDEARPDHEPPIMGVSMCGDDHGKALCCRIGYALQEAAKQLEEYSWFFVLDDDVYVNIDNARQALLARDPSDLIALGIPNCGVEDAGGFCGGAGYIVSQASLRKIMARPPAFLSL